MAKNKLEKRIINKNFSIENFALITNEKSQFRTVCIKFSPDNKYIAVLKEYLENHILEVWEINNKNLLYCLNYRYIYNVFNKSKRLVFINNTTLAFIYENNYIKVVDFIKSENVKSIEQKNVNFLVLSQDKTELLSLSNPVYDNNFEKLESGELKIWDSNILIEKSSFYHEEEAINDVIFTPDPLFIIMINKYSLSYEIKFYSIMTEKIERRIIWEKEYVNGYIWDEEAKLEIYPKDGLLKAEYSKDKNLLFVSSDESVRIFNSETLELIKVIRPNIIRFCGTCGSMFSGGLIDFLLTADSKFIIGISYEGRKLLFYQTEKGQWVDNYISVSSEVIELSEDGKLFAFSEDNGQYNINIFKMINN